MTYKYDIELTQRRNAKHTIRETIWYTPAAIHCKKFVPNYVYVMIPNSHRVSDLYQWHINF